jgi:hypothetical protein
MVPASMRRFFRTLCSAFLTSIAMVTRESGLPRRRRSTGWKRRCAVRTSAHRRYCHQKSCACRFRDHASPAPLSEARALPEAAAFGCHKVSSAPTITFTHRLHTNRASLSRFRYSTEWAGTDSRRESATRTRSARRQTVRQTCNSALSRLPPGSTNERSDGSFSFARSISRSNSWISSGPTRGCFG